ncbi:MAG: hypothetical protein QOI63_1212 [Thermoplasmata archaeon]|jgi:hypothetical protein|nr:hypothetical protein [Thermoplasmata archaeon]
MPRRGAKDWHALMQEMPDVQPWFEYRASRSKDSADVNLRNLLGSLYACKDLTPAELLAMPQEQLDAYMQGFVKFFLKKGDTGSYVSKRVDAVKSYLTWHSRDLVKPIFIPGADDSPNAERQEIPTQEKMAELFIACDLRTAAIVALEAFCGFRPQVLGRNDGADGLRLSDLPELEIKGKKVTFAKVSTLVKVRKNLSKTRKAYFTFLGPEGCDYLAAYLRSRIEAGETLKPDSPVFTPGGETRFMRRGNIQDSVRLRMRKVGFAATTYILRSYFDNRCVMAESHGLPPLYRDFFMGHKGGLQTRYALRKELPPDTIEDMRRAYGKALPFLETRAQPEQERPMLNLLETMLRDGGRSEQEVAKMDLRGMDKAAFNRLLADTIANRVAVQAAPAAGKVRQKVVESKALTEMLEQGWTYRATLADGRAIIEAPA